MGSDIVFLLPNHQQFYAHKVILARSPVFKEQFFSNFLDASSPASPSNDKQLSDTSQEILYLQIQTSQTALEQFLRYCYTDRVELQESNVIEILQIARTYQVTELETLCFIFLKDSISIENVFSILETAKLYGNIDLRKYTTQYIEKHAFEIISECASTLLDLPYENMLEFVSNEFLNVSETELLNICLRWATEQCKKQNISVIAPNLRKLLGDILSNIRLYQVDKDYFVNTFSKSDILTKDEVIAILSYWVTSPSNKDQPTFLPNFKSERKRREIRFLIIGSASNSNQEILHVKEQVEHGYQLSKSKIPSHIVVKTLNAATTNVTVQQLLEFNSILVFSESKFKNSEELGNSIAEYLQQKGGVVLCTFANCNNNLGIRGKFIEDSNLPVSLSAQKNLAAGSSHFMLMKKEFHPIFQQIATTQLEFGKYRSKCEVRRNVGIVLAKWLDDATPLIVEHVNRRVLVCNFYPSSSNLYADTWKRNDDSDRLLFQCMYYVSN